MYQTSEPSWSLNSLSSTYLDAGLPLLVTVDKHIALGSVTLLAMASSIHALKSLNGSPEAGMWLSSMELLSYYLRIFVRSCAAVAVLNSIFGMKFFDRRLNRSVLFFYKRCI